MRRKSYVGLSVAARYLRNLVLQPFSRNAIGSFDIKTYLHRLSWPPDHLIYYAWYMGSIRPIKVKGCFSEKLQLTKVFILQKSQAVKKQSEQSSESSRPEWTLHPSLPILRSHESLWENWSPRFYGHWFWERRVAPPSLVHSLFSPQFEETLR